MEIAQLVQSAQYRTDNRGQQTVVINVDVWHRFLDSLRGVLGQQLVAEIAEVDESAVTCREELAFRRLHPSLLKKYKGQFVAIYQERLVDHDEDQVDLYLRVDEKYSDEFVLIAPVKEQVEEVYRFRSPRVQELSDTLSNGRA